MGINCRGYLKTPGIAKSKNSDWCQLDPSMTSNQLLKPSGSKLVLPVDSDLFWQKGDGDKCLTSTHTTYVELFEVPHKMKSSLVQYQETRKENVSTLEDRIWSMLIWFFILEGIAPCQYLIQSGYYGNKCPEIKIITYLEVNWGQDIRLSCENCFTLLSITVGYETADSTVPLPFPNWYLIYATYKLTLLWPHLHGNYKIYFIFQETLL